MILINLLPHREAARKLRRDVFNISLGTSALVGGLLAGIIFLWYQGQISRQQAKNQVLQTEIKRFDAQIKDIATLEAEITALRARQQAVEDLQADRNLPVHLLTELVRQVPDGIYIASMRQDEQVVWRALQVVELYVRRTENYAALVLKLQDKVMQLLTPPGGSPQA